MVCVFTKCSQTQSSVSFATPSDWKSGPMPVLRADKTYNLASECSSINVLPIWQLRNRPAVYGCSQFWCRGPYLWRGRHLTRHQRHLRKEEKGRTEEWGGKLLDINQHETRGQIQHHHHQVLLNPPNYDIMWIMMLFCCTLRLVTKSPRTLRTHINNFGMVTLISFLVVEMENTSQASMTLKGNNTCYQNLELICIQCSVHFIIKWRYSASKMM